MDAFQHNFGYPKAAFWGVGSPFGASWEVLECPKSAPRLPKDPPRDSKDVPESLKIDEKD